MRVFLVRHAAHAHLGHRLTGRQEGVPLNARGEEQASRLAEAMRREEIGAIHSSPRLRTHATAHAIAHRRGMDVHVEDALDEIDYGGWTGMHFAELEPQPLWRQWNSRRTSCRPPDGETMQQAAGRLTRHIETFAARHSRPLLCVSHCDVIRGALCHYLGLDLDNFMRFDIDPASVSIVDLYHGGGKVVAMNRVFA